VTGETERRLKKMQEKLTRLSTALNQLSAKIDVNTLLADENVKSEEIEVRRSRIIDGEP
jgi:hypothetical protein